MIDHHVHRRIERAFTSLAVILSFAVIPLNSSMYAQANGNDDLYSTARNLVGSQPHNEEALVAAGAKLQSIFTTVFPKLGISSQDCTIANPDHSELATGTLKLSLGRELTYSSHLGLNLGMGSGVSIKQLKYATVVDGRALVAEGSSIVQMLRNCRKLWIGRIAEDDVTS